MTDRPCEQLRDMLVDYADGELPERDSRVVTAHLAECPACREVVRNLHRSLHLAKAVWLDNLESSQVARAGTRVRTPVVYWLRLAAVAAVVLVTVGGTFLLCTTRRTRQPALTYAQIERQVTRAATAARLLAATQVLAKCDGTESIVEQQARYILSRYGDTAAAAELKATMPSILKGNSYD